MRVFLDAVRMAASAHAEQRRSNGMPYLNHCLSVASRVHNALEAAYPQVYPANDSCDLLSHIIVLPKGSETLPVCTDYMTLMAVAVLHDVLEDQPHWSATLVHQFGLGVEALCRQLRNASCDLPPDTPKPVKKKTDLAAIRQTMGPIAALVKMCDRIDNCTSAASDWAPHRRLDYAGWSDELRIILAEKMRKCGEPLLEAAWADLDPQLGNAITQMRVGA